MLSIKLDSILPGTPTIPEQIVSNKTLDQITADKVHGNIEYKVYCEAIEAAHVQWGNGKLDVSELETLLARLLSWQFLYAAQ